MYHLRLLVIFFFSFTSLLNRTYLERSRMYPATGSDNRKELQNYEIEEREGIILGIERTEEYFSLLKGKRVGLIVNQSSHFPEKVRSGGKVHLVDSLVMAGINVTIIFSPEHGFRGNADAGEKVVSGKDTRTGIPIVSLYGSNKKPSLESVTDIDVLLFDIQDVGLRFYTYISTLELCMEAAIEREIPFIVLDRPNPNGHYIDGPVLDKEFQSFIGRQAIPIVHGLTVGEYAQMLIGEKWIAANNIKSPFLTVIPCLNYSHGTEYNLPTAPSPNLPNQRSIYLYPSLCLFEGTKISIGRGTEFPFQVVGHPVLKGYSFSFTPRPSFGAKHPKLEGEKCYGISFTEVRLEELYADTALNIALFIDIFDNYKQTMKANSFFLENNFIDKLLGTDTFRKQVLQGMSANEIKESWQDDLSGYKEMRKKYLLYP